MEGSWVLSDTQEVTMVMESEISQQALVSEIRFKLAEICNWVESKCLIMIILWVGNRKKLTIIVGIISVYT